MIELLHMNERLERFWKSRPMQDRWCAGKRKLNAEGVRLIRRMHADGHPVEEIREDLSEQYGVTVSRQAVHDVIHRRSYADIV